MEKIVGKVGKGRGVGKKLGFPTINIPYSGEGRGIFTGFVRGIGDGKLAAVHLGPRPTFSDTGVVCEAYLIDFDGEISPGTEVEVEVFDKIRDIKKFPDFDQLRSAISDDVEFTKNWYNSRKKN